MIKTYKCQYSLVNFFFRGDACNGDGAPFTSCRGRLGLHWRWLRNERCRDGGGDWIKFRPSPIHAHAKRIEREKEPQIKHVFLFFPTTFLLIIYSRISVTLVQKATRIGNTPASCEILALVVVEGNAAIWNSPQVEPRWATEFAVDF